MKYVVVDSETMYSVGGFNAALADALIVLPGTSQERIAAARKDVKHEGDIYHCQMQRRVVFIYKNDRVTFHSCGPSGDVRTAAISTLLKRMHDGMAAIGLTVPAEFKWEEDCLIDNGIITTKYGVTING